MNQIVPFKPANITPSNFCLRITPYRVTRVLDRSIYEFWKVGCAETSFRSALEDRKIPRQLATLCFISGRSTFQLCYYPWQDRPQIVEELPLERLGEVVENLLAAGFGTRQDIENFQNRHSVPEQKLGEFPKLVSDKTLRVQILPE